MISWWLISIVAIVLFVIIFKSQDAVNLFVVLKKNMLLIISVGLILFFSFSIYRIASIHDIDFTSFEGLMEAGRLYFLWIKSIFWNVGRITGYAINQDWTLNNSLNTTK